MNLSETAMLLAVVQAFDRRTVGESEVIAWQAALRDTGFDDARDAVIEHYRDHREWLMPADVVAGANRIAWRNAGARRRAELEAADADWTPSETVAPMSDAELAAFEQRAAAHGITTNIRSLAGRSRSGQEATK